MAEQQSNWKTVALVVGSIAALITSIATLLPALEPYFASESEGVSKTDSAVDEQAPPSAPEVAQSEPEPDPEPTPLSDADALQAAERIAADYLVALREADIRRLVSLSDPPFFISGSGIFLTRPDLQRYLSETFADEAERPAIPNPERLRAYPLTDAISRGIIAEDAPILTRLSLSGDDVVVDVRVGPEGTKLYFRRRPDGLGLAGLDG